MVTSQWPVLPDGSAVLDRGEVHVCRARLSDDAAAAHALLRELPGDERDRAARLALPLQRTRFILARALLRRVLARYAPADATRPFHYTPRGKPRLARESVHFSLSHSGEYVLLAIAAHPIGVDLERLRTRTHTDAIARRFFPTAVRSALAAAPAEHRDSLFLQAWTQREAAVKALGISVYDRALDLPFALDFEPTIAHCTAGAQSWSLLQLSPWSGTVAAAAAPARIEQLRQWDASALA